MSLSIFMITLAFIILIQSAIPFLLKPTIIFGVTIPESHTDEREISSFKRRYSLIVFLTGLIALVGYYFWANHNPHSEDHIVLTGLAIQFGTLFISMALYLYFHAKTTKLKRLNNWGSGLKKIQIADLQSRSKDEILPMYMYFLPIIVTIGLIAYTISQYSLLPELIPTHWGPNGQPDAFTTKTPFTTTSLLLILLVMQGMMLGINEATRHSGIKLNAVKKKTSQLQQLAFRKYSSWFLFLITMLLTILFGFLQLTTIHGELANDALMMSIPLGFLLLTLIATAVYAFKVGQGGSRIQVTIEEDEVAGITDIDNDDNWKLGVFYINKQDPSIFVEKRFGVGWSINLGNPIGYLILFGPLLLILLIVLFL